MRVLSVVIELLILALIAGCATGVSGHAVDPPLVQPPSLQAYDNGRSGSVGSRYLWGVWDVVIPKDRTRTEISPKRSGEFHLNVLRLLENTCADCLSISNPVLVLANEIEVTVTIKHPWPGQLKYTAFDVRGIFISESNYKFPVFGKTIAWGDTLPCFFDAVQGDANGYTSLFNPTDFPSTLPGPPALKYFPGKHATGGDLTATVNPYESFTTTPERMMFEAGGEDARKVRIRATEGPIHFGYAVNACWYPVDGVINDPAKDFPPEANCSEAVNVHGLVYPGLKPEIGSQALMDVSLQDHQGLETISTVTAEAPDLFGGTIPLVYDHTDAIGVYWYICYIANDNGAATGSYPVLIRVTDTEQDPNLGEVDAWTVTTAVVE